tara:strand:+ start:6623 stop:7372 length:750 start_codon:yes stop_codon:yes gene_type:complete
MNTYFITVCEDQGPDEQFFSELENNNWMGNCSMYKAISVPVKQLPIENTKQEILDHVLDTWKQYWQFNEFMQFYKMQVDVSMDTISPSISKYIEGSVKISSAMHYVSGGVREFLPDDIIVYMNGNETAKWVVDNYTIEWNKVLQFMHDDANLKISNAMWNNKNPINGPPWIFYRNSIHDIGNFTIACFHNLNTTFKPGRIIDAMKDPININNSIEKTIIPQLLNRMITTPLDIMDIDQEKMNRFRSVCS